MSAPRPYNLVAELTYRCPLRCVYCSNPLDYRAVRDDLDADAWSRVFAQAADLGVVHVGLTGGEPTVRRDLPAIVSGAAAAGLFPHLVTAGQPVDEAGLEALRDAGLRSVQLSIQDAVADASDAVAGVTCFEGKRVFAGWVAALSLPLTLNVVLHRRNIERIPALVALARSLGARRLELAHTQYYGWARHNRAALLPSRAQVEAAGRDVERERAAGDLEILYVLPDYFADRPKPCMGGWARKHIVVRPDGRVLPCHASGEIPDLEFWSVSERDLRSCWEEAPGMNAFRGEAWMPEPCRSCEARTRDFGGCRCQAWQWTGDPARTDPACSLSPDHEPLRALRDAPSSAAWHYRGESTAAS